MAYMVKPRSAARWVSDNEEESVDLGPLTVFESARPTGLLNANGDEIVRVTEPIGFKFSAKRD